MPQASEIVNAERPRCQIEFFFAGLQGAGQKEPSQETINVLTGLLSESWQAEGQALAAPATLQALKFMRFRAPLEATRALNETVAGVLACLDGGVLAERILRQQLGWILNQASQKAADRVTYAFHGIPSELVRGLETQGLERKKSLQIAYADATFPIRYPETKSWGTLARALKGAARVYWETKRNHHLVSCALDFE